MSDFKASPDLEQRIIQAIQSIPDEMMMLSDVASILGQEFKTDICLIIAGVNHQHPFESAYWTGNHLQELPQEIVPQLLSQPWIKALLQDLAILVIADLSQPSYDSIAKSFSGFSLGSLLVITTQFHGQANGIILLGKQQSYQWNTDEKTLLETVSNVVAIACYLMSLKLSVAEELTAHDASIHSSLNQLPKVLENNPILKLWWGATRKQLDQQLDWNKQLISNIITIMSDQTRNPLASIKMGLTMLRKKQFSPEVLEQRLDILEQEWQKLNEINEKILQLKLVKSEQLTVYPTEFNLERLIEELSGNFQQQWQQNKRQSLSLEYSFDPCNGNAWKVYLDENHLKNILTELLNNASKFAIPNSTICLNVSQDNSLETPQIVITLTNLSRFVSSRNLRDFFEPFYREQWVIDTAIPGIGLGLTIIKELVELLNGTIEISNQSTDNSEHCIVTVKLTFPLSSL
ncbi:histidine kinase [Rippkaea orientalis PCC 8801]|uniref:histidine kinase n=1 Tax=Rippkaea orientalis (strain PCC 8801 / RF-1) TaxID=41431 RepID=B7K3N1_RIPO1|nr:ATP-binding protein [Rippkaea orientalis]ACK65373.1 histidine kinase [Rippkaea orientalis PCC 8801]